jgi:hypothetical protein
MKKTLFLFIALALAAACGGAQTPEPTSPTDPAGTGTAAPTSPAPTSTAPMTGDAGATTAPPTTSPARAETRPITPTEMGPALKELGIDVKRLPPLNKIPPDKIRKVMNTFTKALGTKCDGCHDIDDFKKATPNKKVAARMWNEFVRGFEMEGGGAVYCDSCHGGGQGNGKETGSMTFLVRDPGLKALSKWMDENMVSKLKKTNGQPHSCETCHGDPMEGKFLHTWKK